jgi:hypothetical protein
MAATFSATTAYTLAELRQFYNEDGKLSEMIKLLYQDNPILQDIRWKSGNQTDGHKGKILTSLPTTNFRRLYQGTAYSKAGIATVRETCRQISTRWGVDVDEIAMYEGTAEQNQFRLQEGMHHIESMQQFAVQQMLYGNPDSDPDEIRGLSAHYPYSNSPNVVNAGGSGTGCTSIWGIVWGEMDFCGIYPKNMPAGIRHEDLGKFDAEDASGNPYRAVGDEWKWDLGFFLADWRSVVRIANIKVANLSITDTSDASFIDLHKLTIEAKNKIKPGKRSRMRWYVPEQVMNGLEYQASNHSGNVHLHYGQWQDSKEVLMLHGKPVLECDGISENETALSAG